MWDEENSDYMLVLAYVKNCIFEHMTDNFFCLVIGLPLATLAPTVPQGEGAGTAPGWT